MNKRNRKRVFSVLLNLSEYNPNSMVWRFSDFQEAENIFRVFFINSRSKRNSQFLMMARNVKKTILHRYRKRTFLATEY